MLHWLAVLTYLHHAEKEEDKKRYGEIRELAEALNNKKNQPGNSNPGTLCQSPSTSSTEKAGQKQSPPRTDPVMEKNAIHQRLSLLENLLRQQIANGIPLSENKVHDMNHHSDTTGSQHEVTHGPAPLKITEVDLKQGKGCSGDQGIDTDFIEVHSNSKSKQGSQKTRTSDDDNEKRSKGKVAQWMMNSMSASNLSVNGTEKNVDVVGNKPKDTIGDRCSTSSEVNDQHLISQRYANGVNGDDRLTACTSADWRPPAAVTSTSDHPLSSHSKRDVEFTRNRDASVSSRASSKDDHAPAITENFDNATLSRSTYADSMRSPSVFSSKHQQPPELKPALVTGRTSPLISPVRSANLLGPKPILAGMTYMDTPKRFDVCQEDTITALKRLLEERNAELSDLKQSYADMEVELQQLRTPNINRQHNVTSNDRDKELEERDHLNYSGRPPSSSEFENPSELERLQDAYNRLDSKLRATEKELRECRHDKDSAQIAHELHAKQLEQDNARLRQQLARLRHGVAERRDDYDNRGSETVSSQGWTDGGKLAGRVKAKVSISSDLTDGRRSAESLNYIHRDRGIGNRGYLSRSADEHGSSKGAVSAPASSKNFVRSKYYDRTFATDNLKSYPRKYQSTGRLDTMSDTASNKITSDTDLLSTPMRKRQPVDDVLGDNTIRPRYRDSHTDRIINDILTGDSASAAVQPPYQCTDDTPKTLDASAGLTLDDLTTNMQASDANNSLVATRQFCGDGENSNNIALQTSATTTNYDFHGDDDTNSPDNVDRLLEIGADATSDHKQRLKERRDSVESTSTEAILTEAEHTLHQNNGILLEMDTAEFTKGTNRPGGLLVNAPRSLSPCSQRSISPIPLVTQHNKHLLPSPGKDPRFNTSARRAFAPRTPADVQLGDVVKFSRQGGRISRGLVKYMGHLPGKNDTYLGVELEKDMGKHDGCYEGQRYFQCKPNRGVFVAFSKIVLAWST